MPTTADLAQTIRSLQPSYRAAIRRAIAGVEYHEAAGHEKAALRYRRALRELRVNPEKYR